MTSSDLLEKTSVFVSIEKQSVWAQQLEIQKSGKHFRGRWEADMVLREMIMRTMPAVTRTVTIFQEGPEAHVKWFRVRASPMHG